MEQISKLDTLKVSFFFRLDFLAHMRLKDVLSTPHFQFKIMRIPHEIGPGVEIGPPLIRVAQFKSVELIYQQEKYLLHASGPIAEIQEMLSFLSDGFDSAGYPIDEITRFYEFDLRDLKVGSKGMKFVLRDSIQVPKLEKLERTLGVELGPYNLSISYPETPMSDEWLHITMTPDHFAPTSFVFLRIIKRSLKMNEFRKFLSKIEDIVEWVFSNLMKETIKD